MFLVMSTEPQTFLDGYPMVADLVRMFIIITGFTLAMVSIKVGLGTARDREWERALGSLSFACFAVTPSISGLYRFGEPLILWTTISYLMGLFAGVAATCYLVTLRWGWLQGLMERRREARRDRAARR